MSDHYWYFAPDDRCLRYGDNRLIEVGTTHTVEPPLELCNHGLHASRRAIDALQYAPGSIVCRVKLGGYIRHGDDKSCATERTYLSMVDAEDTLRAFARRCALDVIDLWDAPHLVREYLETGDEDIRTAARGATWDAAWCAARAAARTAAGDAAGAAAWCAARAAAWCAARTEKMTQYNGWLEEMLLDLEGGVMDTEATTKTVSKYH